MLYLIGIGLTLNQLTLEGLHALQRCDKIYVETYTSKYSEGTILQLEKLIHKLVISLNREQVENQLNEIVKEARHESVALLVYGNPLSATTHHTILIACEKEKIPYHVIPGISIFNYRGIVGLDEYRFGRTTTFVFPQEGYEPLSPFDMIVANKKQGLHTHCLFDLHPETQRFMTVSEAITFIQSASNAREINIHTWLGIGMGGMGRHDAIIHSGNLDRLKKKEWNIFPQSMVVCGDLTPYEREALQTLTHEKWV
ncbi:MAG: diphthine synthase [Candidatus Diapherotrites archaeon]